MHLPFPRGPINTVLLAFLLTAFPGALAVQTTPGDGDASTSQQARSELRLYRGLFSIVAHKERTRLNSPAPVPKVSASEESLRSRIDLPEGEWQSLVNTAVKVDAYTEESDNQARAAGRQARADSAHSLDPKRTLDDARAALHKTQLEQNARISEDIKDLETKIGADGTEKVHAFLEGPLAASAHVIRFKSHSGAAQ